MTEPVSVKWPAPAKLNLFLHVTGQRENGYHELQTLFQLIDLCDELEFEPNSDGLICRIGSHDEIPAEQDLVIRAARLLQSLTDLSRGATIRLHKNIPVGGGLGGGSSDAATTLLVLNRLWGCNLSIRQLAQLGMSLGADVPLFIHGHTALASGIGEQLQPLELGEKHYVLVQMPLHISTAKAFKHPALQRNCPLISEQEALAGSGVNVFETVVRRMYSLMAEVLDDLRQYGDARMTGTGSSIFLEVPDLEAAMKTTQRLNSLYNVRAVRGLDISPVHAMLRTLV
ncbi:MAG: 4-(cytidine 5'-diphospho)-2-C-methyl-D-erythritol kinase [Xanthomonadales bacterium]|nr:4-(cytidine 5'-diphospho)-2-C-methyl-D-erythritol kinase [Xanthomonadales bacterium]